MNNVWIVWIISKNTSMVPKNICWNGIPHAKKFVKVTVHPTDTRCMNVPSLAGCTVPLYLQIKCR